MQLIYLDDLDSVRPASDFVSVEAYDATGMPAQAASETIVGELPNEQRRM